MATPPWRGCLFWDAVPGSATIPRCPAPGAPVSVAGMAAALPIGIRSAGPGWALQRDFARLLVLAIVLPALILCALLAWSEASSLRTEAAAQLNSVADATARDFDEFLRVHGAVVNVVAARRSEERTLGDRARWAADLARLRRSYPAFDAMRVLDAQGRVIAAEPADPTHALGACFPLVVGSGEPVVSDVYGGAEGGASLACLGAPLRSGDRVAGVVEDRKSVV